MEKQKRESYAYRPKWALARPEVTQALSSRNLQWKEEDRAQGPCAGPP